MLNESGGISNFIKNTDTNDHRIARVAQLGITGAGSSLTLIFLLVSLGVFVTSLGCYLFSKICYNFLPRFNPVLGGLVASIFREWKALALSIQDDC